MKSQGLVNAQMDNLKIVWGEFRASYRAIAISADIAWCDDVDFNKRNDFDGQRKNWRTFKDLFDRITHLNAAIPNETKVQYLKSCLKGKAASWVEYLPPTEESYIKCYEVLCDRYENKREIVCDLIDQILDIEVQKSESSNDLKMIHDKTFECMMSIQNAGISVENWDVLLCTHNHTELIITQN